MISGKTLVGVTCSNEGVVIGTIEIPDDTKREGHLLTSSVVWSTFKPVVESYRLAKTRQGDGQVLRCPRCEGMLCVVGDNATLAKETAETMAAREAARERTLSMAEASGSIEQHIKGNGVPADLVPITLGKTRVNIQN